MKTLTAFAAALAATLTIASAATPDNVNPAFAANAPEGTYGYATAANQPEGNVNAYPTAANQPEGNNNAYATASYVDPETHHGVSTQNTAVA